MDREGDRQIKGRYLKKERGGLTGDREGDHQINGRYFNKERGGTFGVREGNHQIKGRYLNEFRGRVDWEKGRMIMKRFSFGHYGMSNFRRAN